MSPINPKDKKLRREKGRKPVYTDFWFGRKERQEPKKQKTRAFGAANEGKGRRAFLFGIESRYRSYVLIAEQGLHLRDSHIV